jgi:ubiquinone biosynthesis protein
MHQGNLFALPDGRIAAIDFGKGRIDRRARVWLAEILYGLITGNYKRVAEIHFEAGYVPPHHNVAEFATTLRAVGEPMRGLPVKDMSVGAMLDGRFNITRDFDMTQPHLLVLQKTMVMVEASRAGSTPTSIFGKPSLRSSANGSAPNSAPRPRSPTGSSPTCAPSRACPN